MSSVRLKLGSESYFVGSIKCGVLVSSGHCPPGSVIDYFAQLQKKHVIIFFPLTLSTDSFLVETNPQFFSEELWLFSSLL